MSQLEQPYLDLLKDVLHNGTKKADRTGTGTISSFARQIRFDLSRGFPLLTTKKMHTKSIIGELLWFLRGETNVRSLQEEGIRIWNEWADADGELGPVYGKQWRSWQKADGTVVDQISNLVDSLKNNPNSRRMLVNAWNVGEIDKMALPPCHMLFQCYVVDGKLSVQLYQRSADLFLGVPFNIASYSLLTHLLALECGLEVGEFIWTGGDCHIYQNHIEQVELQLSRTPYVAPTLNIKRKPKDIYSYTLDDFAIENYKCHDRIAAAVAV